MADTEKNTAENTGTEERKRYESEVENIGPCKVEVRITVPVETLTEEFDERYAEIISTVAFPGFRIGHAPRRLVEKKLGSDVLTDVKENVVAESFKEAIAEHDLEPISDPDVDVESLELDPTKPLEYQTTLIVRPKVEIPDYEGISIEGVKPEVRDERVQEVIESLRRQHAVLESAEDGVIADGDIAVIDVVAQVGDEKLVDRENVQWQHPEPFVAGFHAPKFAGEILGKKAGDEVSTTETLPETWPQPEHAGKDVTITATVQEVKRHRMPDVDAAFAEELDYDSVEELEEEVRAQVEREAEAEAREATDKKMVDALIEAAPFELPEDVVKEETTRRIARTQAMLRMKGASDEEVEKEVAEANSAERAEVEREFRSGFLLDAIGKKEKVFVTETEVDERVAQMAAAYHRTKEEMEQYLEQRDMMGSIRNNMREEKVMEILRKKVKIGE